MQLSPLQKMSVSVGAALFVLGLFAAMAYYYASRLAQADRAVERANTTIASALHVVVARQDAERAAKAYVVRADSSARRSMQEAQSRVEEALDAMSHASEDNPVQHRAVLELGRRVAASFDAFRATLLTRDHAGADSARRYLNSDLRALAADSLVRLAAQIRDEELRVLAERTRIQSAHSVSAQRVILMGMVLSFLLAGVALQPMRAEVHARLSQSIARDPGGVVPELVEAERQASLAATERLRHVHRLIAALAGTRDAASGARELVAASTNILGVVFAAIIVPNGAGGFSVLASSDAGFDSVSPELAVAVAGPLRTGEAAMAESRAERDRQWGTLAAFDTVGARGAAVFVPLTREGAVNGVLVAAHAGDHVFGDDVLTCAATIGRLGGPAVAARPLTS